MLRAAVPDISASETAAAHLPKTAHIPPRISSSLRDSARGLRDTQMRPFPQDSHAIGARKKLRLRGASPPAHFVAGFRGALLANARAAWESRFRISPRLCVSLPETYTSPAPSRI